MQKFTLERTITEEKFRFYLESSTHFRFPFFDPENPYRKNGLFVQFEETLREAGEKFKKTYGENFVSINLRGSWLRGIPLEEDDIDLLFIVKGLPRHDREHMLEHCRRILRQKNDIYRVCEGKVEGGIRVEPITFLDLENLGTIMNSFMYGLGQVSCSRMEPERDAFQDSFLGSRLRSKMIDFLKSGILIPYVGWIYGRSRKKEVFDELAQFMPIPTRKTGIYGEIEVDETKEIIRQTFIARNLIHPSIKVRHFLKLRNTNISEFKKEAFELYRSLEPLETIHARAVLNYLYTAAVEVKFFGKSTIKDRVKEFTGTYDMLVDYILHA